MSAGKGDTNNPGNRHLLMCAGVPNSGCHSLEAPAAAGNTASITSQVLFSPCSTSALNTIQEVSAPQSAQLSPISHATEQAGVPCFLPSWKVPGGCMQVPLNIIRFSKQLPVSGSRAQLPLSATMALPNVSEGTSSTDEITTDEKIHMYRSMQESKNQINERKQTPFCIEPSWNVPRGCMQVPMDIIEFRLRHTGRGLRAQLPLSATTALHDVSEGASTRLAGSDFLSPGRTSTIIAGDMTMNSRQLANPDEYNLEHLRLNCLYDEASNTEGGTESSQLRQVANFCDSYSDLGSMIQAATRETRVPHSHESTTLLAESTTDENNHMCQSMNKRLKAQMSHIAGTPFSTPTVANEKTPTQIEMQRASAAKTKTKVFSNQETLPLKMKGRNKKYRAQVITENKVAEVQKPDSTPEGKSPNQEVNRRYVRKKRSLKLMENCSGPVSDQSISRAPGAAARRGKASVRRSLQFESKEQGLQGGHSSLSNSQHHNYEAPGHAQSSSYSESEVQTGHVLQVEMGNVLEVDNSTHHRNGSLPGTRDPVELRTAADMLAIFHSVPMKKKRSARIPRNSLSSIIDPENIFLQESTRLPQPCMEATNGPSNVLVPYGGAVMVPNGRPLPIVMKKQRPQAKVDLDFETTRVWNLLMGKSAELDGTDVDKERWWQQEREVFKGRANSFIACMRFVQGDRRFSPWKGSVVDSVVGAFLTQSVDDHRSSSAYMALAACFPSRSINNNCKDDATTVKLNHDKSSCFEEPDLKENESMPKKTRTATEKNTKNFDWDKLRRQVCNEGQMKERSFERRDSVDWEAVRCANVKKIAEAIRERGMNNILAERIQDFLNRLVRDQKSIDLEWLRLVSPEIAKDFLLSIYGQGLKSVECVRLLTLHHPAFPVDTNVSRICVRLGWVPIKPLPESLQLHLVEHYPILENIQKYLWTRLCKLNQETLYELHYQMITFGKVFCTKRKPNCNACPMRIECKHYASAFASARLALPAPQDKTLLLSSNQFAFQNSSTSCSSGQNPMNSIHLPCLEGSIQAWEFLPNSSEPIIEEPESPKGEGPPEIMENDIEDFYEDGEILTIDLNMEAIADYLKNCTEESNNKLKSDDIAKALVVMNTEAATIPVPKLKNVHRLRTKHYVYELPDAHPLLEELGFAKREPHDPSPYLLAIWTPDGIKETTNTQKPCCDPQLGGDSCNNEMCKNCTAEEENQSEYVRGTILVPCRTATRGSFPLNGTYFQVNEVFADHESSRDPILVRREQVWNLPRKMVYCGTSVSTIFKGLATDEIQHCFWNGFVCVREFDMKTRAPKPLIGYFHRKTNHPQDSSN